MKKRYIGIVHLTPEGDGVIEILEEAATSSSLRTVEHHYRTLAAERSPY